MQVWSRLRRSTLAMLLLIATLTGAVTAFTFLSINNTATVSGPVLQAQSVPSTTTVCPATGYMATVSLAWGTVLPSSVNSQLVCLINTGNTSYSLAGCNITPTSAGTVTCTPATGTIAAGATQLVTVTWTAPATPTGSVTFQITFS